MTLQLLLCVVARSPKPCDRCQAVVALRYRVQLDASGQWLLICQNCWHACATNNPNYRYGGTWKAK